FGAIRSVLGGADAELGHADAEPGTNVARLLADPVVHLGHARERVDRRVDGLHGVVGTAAAGASVADSLWREHRNPSWYCWPVLLANAAWPKVRRDLFRVTTPEAATNAPRGRARKTGRV